MNQIYRQNSEYTTIIMHIQEYYWYEKYQLNYINGNSNLKVKTDSNYLAMQSRKRQYYEQRLIFNHSNSYGMNSKPEIGNIFLLKLVQFYIKEWEHIWPKSIGYSWKQGYRESKADTYF